MADAGARSQVELAAIHRRRIRPTRSGSVRCCDCVECFDDPELIGELPSNQSRRHRDPRRDAAWHGEEIVQHGCRSRRVAEAECRGTFDPVPMGCLRLEEAQVVDLGESEPRDHKR